MNATIWVCFETPSVKESNRIEKMISGTPLQMVGKESQDYLKLIKDRDSTLLGVYNKFNNEIIFTDKIDDMRKEKILSLIEQVWK